MLNKDLYFKYMELFPDAFLNPKCLDSGIHIVTDPARIEEIEATVAARLQKKGLPTEYSKVGVVYKDPYITILRDAVLFQPDNTPGTYIRQFNSDNTTGVVVLPIYNGKVCLLNIFRHSLRKYVLELPRGFGELNSTPSDNAKRELLEETSLVPKEIHSLGYMVENSGLANYRTALFFAVTDDNGTSPHINSLSNSEGINKLVFVEQSEFFNMISTGEIEDSFSIVTAMRALLKGYLNNSI